MALRKIQLGVLLPLFSSIEYHKENEHCYALNQAFITAKYKKYINLSYRGTQYFPVFIPHKHTFTVTGKENVQGIL